MTGKVTIGLTEEQAASLAELLDCAAIAFEMEEPGVVLAQVVRRSDKGGAVELTATFIPHRFSLAVISVLDAGGIGDAANGGGFLGACCPGRADAGVLAAADTGRGSNGRGGRHGTSRLLRAGVLELARLPCAA